MPGCSEKVGARRPSPFDPGHSAPPRAAVDSLPGVCTIKQGKAWVAGTGEGEVQERLRYGTEG